MKAIVLKEFGGTENLVIDETPLPEIKDNEVLVRVKAISINPVDVKTRSGKGLAGRIKDQHLIILGWDISGTVTETGTNVTAFKRGDEVFGMVNFPGLGNAYAEYVAAPVTHLALKPSGISHEEAAGATLAALTALQGLTQKAKIKEGFRVLIHSAAGGVGHFAVQIAKRLGAYVIGTASEANRDFVLGLGADEHIDYKAHRFEDLVKEVDFVLDTIGGDNIDRSFLTMKKGATIISIPSGLNAEITEKAEALGLNGFFFLVESNGEDMKEIAGLLEDGSIRSHISKVFSFQEMGEAHLQVESGSTRGKVVVTI